jgi:hypothetical protein
MWGSFLPPETFPRGTVLLPLQELWYNPLIHSGLYYWLCLVGQVENLRAGWQPAPSRRAYLLDFFSLPLNV